ncbi:MAG: hypothetical protein N3D73_03280 [Candidatus Diapherotrites archaeon]|nr:hypothetical protein [Candidatus Diapherotrites archaeon]
MLKSHPWKAGRFIVEKKFHGPSDKGFRKALRYFYAEAKWFISKSASAGLIRPTTAIPIIIVPEPVTKFEFVCWFPSLLSDFHLDSSIDLCQKKIYQKDIS